MQLRVKRATLSEIPEIAALWKLVVQRLSAQFGHPVWLKLVTPEAVYREMHRATVYVIREGASVIAAFTLSMQKPWTLDEGRFQPAMRPLYMTDLGVHPRWVRSHIDIRCIRAAIRIAKDWPSDALRLGVWDQEIGRSITRSGLGFRAVGTNCFGEVPCTVFELPISLGRENEFYPGSRSYAKDAQTSHTTARRPS